LTIKRNGSVSPDKVKEYIGKTVYIEQANGTRVEGKVVAVKNGKVYLKPLSGSPNKPVRTSFFFIGLWILGIIAIGLLLWCACCGSRVWGNRGCGCGCRRPPYRARRPYRRHAYRKNRRLRYV